MVTCSHSNHVNQRGYKDKRSQLSTTTRISQLPINGPSRKLKAHPVEITSFPEASVRKGTLSARFSDIPTALPERGWHNFRVGEDPTRIGQAASSTRRPQHALVPLL